MIHISGKQEKQAGGESDEKTERRPDKRTDGAGAGTTERTATGG